jgi:hypothetical protein
VESFAKALEPVADAMRYGAAMHPDNDWVSRESDYHIGRTEEHLRLLQEGDQHQDHLSHAATRLLMALTLRELADERWRKLISRRIARSGERSIE